MGLDGNVNPSQFVPANPPTPIIVLETLCHAPLMRDLHLRLSKTGKRVSEYLRTSAEWTMSTPPSKRIEGNQHYLPRGGACVSCRRRKMKCDGQRPVCGQCDRAGRPDDCEYVVGQERSTVQILEDNISRLEARIQELQKPQSTAIPAGLHKQYVGGSASSTPILNSAPIMLSSTSARSTVQDPPRNVADALLANLMPYAADLGFFLNLAKFRTSMFQPQAPGHPSRPAPSLIFAIYLWAIRLSPDPSVRNMEDSYMQRATQEAATALSGPHPYKVLHSIQAEVLLATYFFASGRFLEGKYHVANAVSTALSASLHKIRSADVSPSHAMSPPRDSTEEGERILAAWTVFNLDKAWAVAFDSDPNFQHSSHSTGMIIDTPWPLEMEEFEQGLLPQHARTSNTINNFLVGKSTPDMGLSTRAIEAKAVVLWERVMAFVKKHNYVLSRPDNQNLGPILQEFTALSTLLDTQIASLPHVSSSPPSPSVARLPPTERTRRILLTHSILGAALIRLHAPFAANGRSETSKRRRLDGARMVLGGLLSTRGRSQTGHYETRVSQAGWLNPIIGSTWIDATQVLFDEIASLRSSGSDERPLFAFIQQAVGVMAEFDVNIPLMDFQVQRIQETLRSI